jgi:hypothetical protein
VVTRRPIRILSTALLTLGLVLGSATTGFAFDTVPIPGHEPNPDPQPGPGPAPGTSTGPSGDSGGSAVGTAGNCSVVSSPSYMGLSCGDGSMTTKSVKQILGKDAVPGCWNDELTGAELDAMSLENRDGTTWYWERCLKGIDPKTMEIGPGGVRFTVGLVGKKAGDKIVTLTKNQQTLVNMYSKEGTIPSPIAGVSPSATPRVGAWVSFFDGTKHLVSVQAGAVVLRAHVASIKVEPLGKGRLPELRCKGIGYRAQHGETKVNHPSGCWYRYAASSADQKDNTYPVNITAHWVVEVSEGAGFAFFNEFDKSQVTNIPVTEIEALVVP